MWPQPPRRIGAPPPRRRIRSALFVDFDNVYIGLDQEDHQAARAFADEPAEWIAWMERLMALPGSWFEPETRRSILMRRCYLSPRRFGRYRPSFTRAGFDVIDCPALTMRGKNSADIRMVIDIFDAMQHETFFDEFIILSSDSDFTPVLSRLRSHDRRTTVLTVGNISGAYRAACDLMIGSEDFIEFGLGRVMLPNAEPVPGPSARGAEEVADEELLKRIAGSVFVEASVNGEIRPEQLASIYIRFPEFTQDSNWLGFYGLRPMTDAVVATRDDLAIENGDPWTVKICKPGAPSAEVGEAPQAADDDLRRRVAEAVEHLVSNAKAPVTLARAAQAITADFGDEVAQTRWAGAGTFKDLLQGVSGLTLAFSTVPPGYVYDPGRHSPPRATVASSLEQRHPELAAFVRRVFQITGVPKLTPEQFALVFQFIASEVNAHGYSLSQTSKEVRDRCQDAGESVPRQAVIFVLKGLSYRGYDFESDEPHAPRILAAMFRDNVIDLCENAGMEMTEKQLSLLDRWLLTELPEP
ncbi:MAG: NYN domain-containing protein [Myxococcales bacterium]|nr:NYN domain-containing protein [Myxococcales bacterium]MCB9525309.1 NYN domain-containing protein [Myxococcales bacterium]